MGCGGGGGIIMAKLNIAIGFAFNHHHRSSDVVLGRHNLRFINGPLYLM